MVTQKVFTFIGLAVFITLVLALCIYAVSWLIYMSIIISPKATSIVMAIFIVVSLIYKVIKEAK